MEQLEQQLASELMARCQKIESTTGISMERLRRQTERFGGRQAVQSYLRNPCDLSVLRQHGILADSIEALAVSEQFGALFSDDTVNACFSALCAVDFF